MVKCNDQTSSMTHAPETSHGCCDMYGFVKASDALVLLDYHESEKVELFCDHKKEQKEQRRQWRKDVWGRK